MPTEEVVEMRDGQKPHDRAQVLPRLRAGADGDDDDETWHLVKNAEGARLHRRHRRPAGPLSDKEADAILHRVEEASRSRGPRRCSSRAKRCA